MQTTGAGRRHPFDGMKATVRGSHRIAANDPKSLITPEHQRLAEMFAGPVELLESFYQQVDQEMLARKSAEGQHRAEHRALEQQQQRLGAVL